MVYWQVLAVPAKDSYALARIPRNYQAVDVVIDGLIE